MILLALASLFPACAQDPQPAAATQPSAEIAAIRAACAKIAEADSYTFHHLALDEGMPMGPSGGRGGAGRGGGEAGQEGGGQAAPPQPPAPVPMEFTAQVRKGQPVHFQQGPMEAWRRDGVLVWRQDGGAWQRMDMQAMRGGGGRGLGGGDEAEMRSMRSRMGLATAQTAADLLAGFEEKLAGCTRSEEAGKTIYSGTLTPEGAAALSGMGRMMGRGRGGAGAPAGEGGDGPPPIQNSGTYRVVVDAEGRVESLTLDTLSSGSFGERSFERKRRLEYRISLVGSTVVEAPAEVNEMFAAKPAEGGLEF